MRTAQSKYPLLMNANILNIFYLHPNDWLWYLFSNIERIKLAEINMYNKTETDHLNTLTGLMYFYLFFCHSLRQ